MNLIQNFFFAIVVCQSFVIISNLPKKQDRNEPVTNTVPFQIKNTEVINLKTSMPISDHLWEPAITYEIRCSIEGTNLSKGEFEGFQKSCLLTETCQWDELAEDMRQVTGLVSTIGEFARTARIRGVTAAHPMSYRINFNKMLCYETDYYPSFGYGINNSSIFYVGNQLKLICFFDSDTFYFDGWQIDMVDNEATIYVNDSIGIYHMKSHENVYLSYSELTIDNVTVRNDGNYTCKVEPKINITISYPVYILKVYLPQAPYFDDPQNESICIEYGSLIRMSCSAHGKPTPSIQWYDTDNKTVHKGSDYQIEILNSTWYRCNIKNYYDSASKYFNIFIRLNSTIFVNQTGSLESNLIIIIFLFIVIFSFALLLITINTIRGRIKVKKMLLRLTEDNIIRLEELDPGNPAITQFNNLSINPEFMIPRNKLFITDHLLGEGHFGYIRKGFLYADDADANDADNGRDTVAVKLPKSSNSYMQHSALITELMIMSKIGRHINLLSAYGAVVEYGQLCIVLDFCQNGSLLEYLRKKKDCFVHEYENVVTSLPIYQNEQRLRMVDLLKYSFQVSSGMEYLSGKNIVHCDLALRNILLTENEIVKIADFGLAFDSSSSLTNLNIHQLPLRWTALECLISNEFSSQSDIWSFGIVLWEIFTLGQTPYATEPQYSIKAYVDFLSSGRRLSQPTSTNDILWDLMKQCWAQDKYLRPAFVQCKQKLGEILCKQHSSEARSLWNMLNSSNNQENLFCLINFNDGYVDANI